MRSFPPSCPIDDARLEQLESRLLLSAGALADTGGLAAAAGLTQMTEPAWDLIEPTPEAESQGGASNDQVAAAQPLSFVYLLPKISPDDGVGPQHASVVGVADGLGGGGEEYSDWLMVFGAVSNPNVYTLDFTDAIAPGGAGVLRVSAAADLAGTERYLALEAEGIDLGQIFVDDGAYMSTVTAEVSLSQDQLAVLAADGTVTVTVTPSAAVATVSESWMDAELTYSGPGGAGTADFYSVDLAAGESLSIGLAGPTASQLEMQLVAADGTVLAEGATGYDNFCAAVESYTAQQTGTLYIRVAGEGDYQLANRNAALDLEDNGAAETAQAIDGARASGRIWVIGQLDDGSDSDFYAVTLASRAVVKLQASAPADASLEPVVNLYDAGGDLVATSADSRSGMLHYKAPRGGGEYFVQISADDGSGGYVLGVGGQAAKPSPDKPGKGLAKGQSADPPGRRLGTLRNDRHPAAVDVLSLLERLVE